MDSPDFEMSDLSAAPELKDRIRRNFSSFVPILKGLAWEAESVGLLTIPMDGEPLLGPLEEPPGFFTGLAFQGSGFAYNPGAGLLLAECVADGRTSIDISAFSPSRFDRAESEAYLSTTLTEGQLGLPIRRHGKSHFNPSHGRPLYFGLEAKATSETDSALELVDLLPSQ